MIPHDRILPYAIEKTREKDSHYGHGKGRESWETMPIESLVAAIKYKVDRAIQPGTSVEKTKDDLGDAYNFVAALFERKIPEEQQP